jgi:hypothetical protein
MLESTRVVIIGSSHLYAYYFVEILYVASPNPDKLLLLFSIRMYSLNHDAALVGGIESNALVTC